MRLRNQRRRPRKESNACLVQAAKDAIRYLETVAAPGAAPGPVGPD